jgi:PEP-CTERM motif-containing protein
VQLVALVHHAVKQSPVVVCESIVHVQKQGFLSIGEARKIVVDTIGLGVLASAICFPYLAVSCHSFPQPLPSSAVIVAPRIGNPSAWLGFPRNFADLAVAENKGKLAAVFQCMRPAEEEGMFIRYRLPSFIGALVATAALFPAIASAEPVSLTVNTETSLQQILNRPCVIGDPSCHNKDVLPYTLIGPRMGSGTLESPTYTVQQLRDLIGGDTFSIGVDLNQAMGHDNGAYDLLRFTMSVNGTIVSSTTKSWTLIPTNPGNGFSDAAILGFDLSGFAPTDKVVFATTFSGARAGREQYFLQTALGTGGSGPASPVPEPASIILLGSGLAGIAAAYRRKRTRNE